MRRASPQEPATPEQVREVVRLRDAGMQFSEIAARFGWRRMQRAHTIYRRAKAGTYQHWHAAVAERDRRIVAAVEAGAITAPQVAAALGLARAKVKKRMEKIGFDRQEREECARAFARARARHGSDTRRPAAAEPAHGRI